MGEGEDTHWKVTRTVCVRGCGEYAEWWVSIKTVVFVGGGGGGGVIVFAVRDISPLCYLT